MLVDWGEVSILGNLLAAEGRDVSDLPSTGVLGELGRRAGVTHTPEVDRVAALEAREPVSDEFVRLLSQHLRTRETNDEGEANMLRPAQALALRELYEYGGLVAPMRCGSGKTLVTLLAPTLLQSKRPLLLVPASLRDKTRRDFARYRLDWRVRLPKILSYEELSRKNQHTILEQLDPDLVLCDEAHKIRNRDAACTRRVDRFRKAKPSVVWAELSGTLIDDRLAHYRPAFVRSLGDRAPVPLAEVDAEEWAAYVDRDVPTRRRMSAGALEQLGDFHEYMRSRRGVVPTPGSECDAGIEIATWSPELPETVSTTIREVTLTGERPDGILLGERELPDCLCQLALGFYYVWDPLPPAWWLTPRSDWVAWVRERLDEHHPEYDSTEQLAAGLDHGKLRDTEGKQALEAWRAVKHRFEPNRVPVWVDRGILTQAIDRAGDGCLVWVRYRAAGFELARQGVEYFGEGTHAEAAEGRTIAASIAAHGTGANLQAWARNLVLTPPAGAHIWEQLLARTHREGQKADTVFVDLIDAIGYHSDVVSRARSQARAVGRASGFSQKLVEATWI